MKQENGLLFLSTLNVPECQKEQTWPSDVIGKRASFRNSIFLVRVEVGSHFQNNSTMCADARLAHIVSYPIYFTK